MNFSTKKHEKYWKDRKIDWNASYLDGIDPVSGQPMWNHPHRNMIIAALATFNWISLFEVGCGGGANFKKILAHFKGKQLAGSDVNPEAIEFMKKTFTNSLLYVEPAHEMIASEDSVDVVLSDATLIYYGPKDIKKALKEMVGVARHHIILCELHDEKWWKRWLYRLQTGYNVHNYKKLLEDLGAYDIQMVKIPKEIWPGDPWSKFGYVIKAKLAKI